MLPSPLYLSNYAVKPLASLCLCFVLEVSINPNPVIFASQFWSAVSKKIYRAKRRDKSFYNVLDVTSRIEYSFINLSQRSVHSEVV